MPNCRSTERLTIIQPACRKPYNSPTHRWTDKIYKQLSHFPSLMQTLTPLNTRIRYNGLNVRKHKMSTLPSLPSRPVLFVPHLPQSWSHLIGQCTSHDHDISLSRTCSEDHTKAVHVVTRRRHVHHLHSTAGQAEGHRPQRALRGNTTAITTKQCTKWTSCTVVRTQHVRHR